jgi:hypothetical protein
VEIAVAFNPPTREAACLVTSLEQGMNCRNVAGTETKASDFDRSPQDQQENGSGVLGFGPENARC